MFIKLQLVNTAIIRTIRSRMKLMGQVVYMAYPSTRIRVLVLLKSLYFNGSQGVMESKVFIGPIIHSLSINEFELIELGMIKINAEGIIQEIKEIKEIPKFKEQVFILEKNQFLIPGFVNAHVHAPQ